mgnify:CR=1 FL=1
MNKFDFSVTQPSPAPYIREFAIVGNGDYQVMHARIEAIRGAWVGDLVDGKAVVAYALVSETEELLARVVAAAIGSGYVIARTRLRALDVPDYLVQDSLPRPRMLKERGFQVQVASSKSVKDWQDFVQFLVMRNFQHLFRGPVGGRLQCGIFKSINECVAAEAGSVVFAESGSTEQARAGSPVCARGGSTVYAWTDSLVIAECASTVFAYSGSNVYADRGAVVHAEVRSMVTARSGSTVYADGGSYVIACSGSTVHAGSHSNVVAYPGSTVIPFVGSKITFVS